jgi:soluble lytic murein transglycosylase
LHWMQRSTLLGVVLMALLAAGCSADGHPSDVPKATAVKAQVRSLDTSVPATLAIDTPVPSPVNTALPTRPIAPPAPTTVASRVAGLGAAVPTSRLTLPTATPMPRVTASVTASDAQARLANGRWLQLIGECAGARSEFDALSSAAPAIAAEARYRSAQCALRDQAYADAGRALRDLLGSAAADSPWRAPAAFLLGDASVGLKQWSEAEGSYQIALKAFPELAANVWLRIATARRGASNYAGANEAYNTVLSISSDRDFVVAARRGLADVASAQHSERAAVAQYDLLRGEATTGALAAEMQWMAGAALKRAGDPVGAISRWQQSMQADVTSTYAHSSLAALVDAGFPVDEYLRGVIDYFNDQYALANIAFDRYRTVDPQGRNGLAWYYAGLSYLSQGKTEKGLAELNVFLANYSNSALWNDGAMARARALARSGDTTGAIAAYRQFVAQRPAATQAPRALLLAAGLEADKGQLTAAAENYLVLGRTYPAADEGWRGYLAAGLSYFRGGDARSAGQVWSEMATAPLPEWTRTVAYYWLGRAQYLAGEKQAALQSWQKSYASDSTVFYGLRSDFWSAQAGLSLAQNVQPVPMKDTPSVTTLRDGLSSWLVGWAGDGTLQLPAAVQTDADWKRGVALQTLGQRSAAEDAWASVQKKYWADPWVTAALTLAFHEAGAYNLSITGADRLAVLGNKSSVLAGPAALQYLAYPMPYNELLRGQAAARGIDPRLVASVMRQESRFDQGARSTAAAQGLMQVIPDTASWIATQLGWRNFTAEQIYWPYVNVTFGTYYLQQMLQRFDGSVAAALAGYNGGPGNAAVWRAESPAEDDLMVALIDVNETRLYVQLVWENYVVYQRLYTR